MQVSVRELPFSVDPVRAVELIPGTRRFFLDSSLSLGNLGRWSFIGAEPFVFFTAFCDRLLVESAGRTSEFYGDPFTAIQDLLSKYRHFPRSGPPLAAGAVGYFSYDLGRMVEDLPSTAKCDLPLPDIQLGLYDCTLAFDRPAGRAFVSFLESGREKAEEWIALLESARTTLRPSLARGEASSRASARGVEILELPRSLHSNFTREQYLQAIRCVQDYIAAGDVYQVNIAQRFEAECRCGGRRLYRMLREANPAPFGCLIEFDDLVLASVSPERLLSFDAATRLVETRPIKGTRPRGREPESDTALGAELAASQKDRAENVMIVDMERNDIGRVCEYGSVNVPELWAIEAHPNVFQMVSTVRGVLRVDRTPVDLLRACFPGGSVTGAPKVRAMEIIEEIEGVRRGIYTGSAGYIDFSGNMDLNIVIRSVVLSAGRAYFHGGGGILAYSDAEAEYEETLQKISGLAAVLDAAREDRCDT